MKSFSERHGFEESKKIQIDSIDDRLRNKIWSLLFERIWSQFGDGYDPFDIEHCDICDAIRELGGKIWTDVIAKPIDLLVYKKPWEEQYKYVRSEYFNLEWYRVYNLVEYVLENCSNIVLNDKSIFITECNYILKDENSAYRIVSGLVAPITNKIEMKEIENAATTIFDENNQHIKMALAHLSDKTNPDYRNSIKESISAVEAVSRKISGGKSNLNAAFKKLEEKTKIHPQLLTGFKNIYNYTSDDDGIRHALMEKDNLTQDDARFMLVSCSAFVNYLISKAQDAGIIE